jgi:hypothetical protein
MGQTFDLQASTLRHPASNPPAPAAIIDPEGPRLAGYKHELDGFRAHVSTFPDMDPADILAVISGIAGRVAEIRADLMRVNTPRCSRLRTTEIDPLRDDLDFQFRIHSRRIALMEWEFKTSQGGV